MFFCGPPPSTAPLLAHRKNPSSKRPKLQKCRFPKQVKSRIQSFRTNSHRKCLDPWISVQRGAGGGGRPLLQQWRRSTQSMCKFMCGETGRGAVLQEAVFLIVWSDGKTRSFLPSKNSRNPKTQNQTLPNSKDPKPKHLNCIQTALQQPPARFGYLIFFCSLICLKLKMHS